VNLLRTLATVSGMTMLSRITGLAREIVQAYLFGANAQTDAFNVAFRIPNLLRRLFAEGAFSQAFVPILGEFRARRGADETQQLIDDTATVLVFALCGVTVLGIIGAPLIVWLLASGLEAHEGTFGLAVLLTRVMFPYILLISLVSAASGVLNTWRHFAVPAFTPVLLNVSVIACALLLSRWVEPPILSLAIGVTLGGILQLSFQVPALMRLGLFPRVRWRFRESLSNPAVRRVLRQMLPATLAVSVAQFSMIININVATWLGPGSVSWLSYADRLMEFPTALLGAALGTILTPSLSDARARGDEAAYAGLLDWGMRLTFLLALPCAVALIMIAGPITATLFQRGAFSALDVLKTQQAVSAYGVGLIGLVLVKILAPGFYARQDIRTPVKIALGVLVATQLMNLIFVPILMQQGLGHAGLALSTSIGACANALMLFIGLKRRGAIQMHPGWGVFALRLALGLAALTGLLWWTNAQIDWNALAATPYLRIAMLGAVVGAAAVTYFAVLFATGLRFGHFARRI
jgi:putative peptidoglycan lipid II flippase